ncbi:MAG TPA: hypothetical protein VK804_05070 [Bradyrhizobium sp.]|jgi:hypothetical protein|uniref:hypothetical protein n=1 Tax=Bradyrhizobium sp. TaxID=376 RepID=UPI002C872BF5|nr:hypothetical protein [Bradyrhizobium sp.]HTA99830.1 hypothetical protein [Bradyrhizobium sp.]
MKKKLTIVGGSEHVGGPHWLSPTKKRQSLKGRPLGRLTPEERHWLATALVSLKQIFEQREAGRLGNQAYCIFEVGNLYVQFLAPWDGEELLCEVGSAKSAAPIATVFAAKVKASLLRLGFDLPGFSPNCSQQIQIRSLRDLSNAAQLGFGVLKQVYQVKDFGSATFRTNIPEPKEIT